MEKDIVFFRDGVDETSDRIAYYRLDKGMKEFLELCIKKHGSIDAIILSEEEDKLSWNIGFALGKEINLK